MDIEMDMSAAYYAFDQAINSRDFEEWLKNTLNEKSKSEFYFGMGTTGEKQFLCVSSLPYTVSESDVQKCFCKIYCKASKLYDKGVADRDKIRDNCFAIIDKKLNSMHLKGRRIKTEYLLETVYVTDYA